jgi:hypothetical protein
MDSGYTPSCAKSSTASFFTKPPLSRVCFPLTISLLNVTLGSEVSAPGPSTLLSHPCPPDSLQLFPILLLCFARF